MVNRGIAIGVVLGALVLGGCPGGPSGGCVRNSDCASGSYCSGGSCTSDCSDADDCAAGETCSSFGMCLAPPDGGQRDAGPPPSDGGTDAFDPRPACVIAGGTDADGDGHCAGSTGTDDCDDARASVHPGASEICTPQDAAIEDRAIDESCDGAIDEGCAWHFGAPHAVTIVHSPSFAIHQAGQLSADGLRMYLRGFDAMGRFVVTMSTRASLSAPFAAPVEVPIMGVPGPALGGLAVSPDELEIIVDDDRGAPESNLYRATRGSPSASFGPLAPLAVLNTTDRDYAPALSRDGLELFFSRLGADGMRRIHHAIRPSLEAEFGAAEALVIPGASLGDAGVAVSLDGSTILFQRLDATGSRILIATRSAPRSPEFGTPIEAVDLADAGASRSGPSWIDERTAEVLFISTRDWSPASYGVFRARVCRDGPCADPTPIDCPTGIRSPDGLHCYTGRADLEVWGNARAACLSAGGHLVSIHSVAEHDHVWAAFGGRNRWLGLDDLATDGAFVWESGEPFTYSNFDPSNPNGGTSQNCGVLWNDEGLAGRWADYFCSPTVGLASVCETETWPTW
jgi:hypothetical protein